MTKGRMSHTEMSQLLFSSKPLVYMLNKQYMKWKFILPFPLEITSSKMFTNLVSIFEKILLQWTLIFSIWWHVALPFLKLPKAVNVTGLKYDQKNVRNFRNNVFLFYLFFNYHFFPSISLSPICTKIKQETVYKQTLEEMEDLGKVCIPPSLSSQVAMQDKVHTPFTGKNLTRQQIRLLG